MEEQEIKKRPNLLKLFIFICIAVFLCYAAVQMIRQEQILHQQREKIAQMMEQKGELDEEYKALEKELEDCNKLNFIERYLREKLGMLKDGEILFESEDNS